MVDYRLYPGQTLYFYYEKYKSYHTVEVTHVDHIDNFIMVRWNNRTVKRSMAAVGKTLFITKEDAIFYHKLPLTNEELMDDYDRLSSNICAECKACVHRDGPDDCWGESKPCDRYYPKKELL